ncbi:MAG: YczE/YyaS/YitT family protein [Microbacteriaceae bacterium]
MSPVSIMTRRIIQLLVGLFLYGIAISMIIRASIGVAPWDVLSQGIDEQTGWGFGLITVIVGGVVLLLWIPIRQKPGIGTILNVLLIGPAAEVGLAIIPTQTVWWAQALVFAGGLALLAVATGMYIGARMGPGPRDGLMTGIHARWGWKIWIVRTSIEVTVLSIGWVLGGNVGIGTVAFALFIGPMVNFTLPLLRVPVAHKAQAEVEDTTLQTGAAPPATAL